MPKGLLLEPSIWEVESGGLGVQESLALYQVQGQSKLYEALLQLLS